MSDTRKDWKLSRDEVRDRVSSYSEPETTRALDDFGRLLIGANQDRTKDLEGKAILIVGYCLAVLAFLVSRETSVIVGWPALFVRGAGIFAGIGLGFAGAAILVRAFPWFSDSQWFENEKGVLEDVDSLRRCHVMALHAANSALNAANDKKADNIVAAQVLVVLAGLCLAGWAIVR